MASSGSRFVSSGVLKEAEVHFQRSLTMREELFGKDDPVICYSLTNFAVLYEAQGRMDAIDAPLTRCLGIHESAFGPGHPVVAHTLHHIGKIYREQGRKKEAQALGERAVAILGHAHPAALMVLIEEGKYEQAALVLGINNIPEGDRAAAEAAVPLHFSEKSIECGGRISLWIESKIPRCSRLPERPPITTKFGKAFRWN
jgi:hypothetical protein